MITSVNLNIVLKFNDYFDVVSNTKRVSHKKMFPNSIILTITDYIIVAPSIVYSHNYRHCGCYRIIH